MQSYESSIAIEEAATVCKPGWLGVCNKSADLQFLSSYD